MSPRRKLIWAAAVAAGGLSLFSAADARGFRRYLRLQGEVRALEARSSKLVEENRALLEEIDGLRSDRRGLERAAREELGFVRPNEVVIIVE